MSAPQAPNRARLATPTVAGPMAAIAILVGGTVFAVLLTRIGVTSSDLFFRSGRPRWEWSIALGAAIVAYPWLRRREVGRAPPTFLLPLAAMCGLLLESLSLLLRPQAFELLGFFGPTEESYAAVPRGLATEDLATLIVSITLCASSVIAYGYAHAPEQKRTLINRWLLSALVGTALVFLVPVAGPLSGEWITPPGNPLASAAVPQEFARLGFVCLPCLTAYVFALGANLSRGRHRHPVTIRVAVTTGSAVVTVTELATGRYNLASIAMAIVVVLAVETAARFAERLGDARGEPLSRTVQDAPAPSSLSAPPTTDDHAKTKLLLTAVFFLSGMAALVYQVVFAKGLALTFGSTSHASTIVLATYMGGLALGSWLGGRLADRMARPIVGYALSEVGIAALCAASPITLKLARQLYVYVARGADPSESWLLFLQLALGTVVLVPPTLLMGLTMPLLTRQFLDDRSTLGSSAGRLYTANTFGAAIGGSITGYVLLPTLGVARSLYTAVAVNVVVSVLALLAARSWKRPDGAAYEDGSTTRDEGSPHADSSPVPTTSGSEFGETAAWSRLLGRIAIVQLAVGGFVTFGLETTFVHLLATVAGTSAYAFSLMLFAFLVGLSAGSYYGRKWLPPRAMLPVALLLCQLALSVTLLLGSAYWDSLPSYFASFGRWPYALTFASREFIRFVVCMCVMVPPALCIGAQFPIAMECIGLGWPLERIIALGRASALNTVGNILGAIVVGFLMLPRLGSHRTLSALTFLSIALAGAAVLAIRGRPRVPYLAVVGSALAFLILSPPNFDLTRLASGGNVYFKPQYYGQVIDAAESLDGGLTTVALSHDGTRTPVKTLLTNAKFQGNDRRDNSGEMMAQTSFAIAPLLHTTERQRALVIGFGTGTTTRVLDEAGFVRIDVAELSGDILTLADRHFSTINGGVLHRPNVSVHVTDGRNFLMLDRGRYDLISIELSSIWFAGAANLYNDEFYQLLESRLSERGVLQQWVQLHRLSHRDIMAILATLNQRFPRVWLYFLGKQGILVACKHDCSPKPAMLRQLNTTPRLKPSLALFPKGLWTVLESRLLMPASLDATLVDFLQETGLSRSELLSTDDNLYLEYSTPKGNVREYDESLYDNVSYLERQRPASPFEGTRLTEDDVAKSP